MSTKLSAEQAAWIDKMCPISKKITLGSRIAEIEGNYGPGTIWYVHKTLGADKNDGLTWASALATIAAAVSAASAGDIIRIHGTFTEVVVSAKDSLTIIGEGDYRSVWMEAAAGNTLLTLTGKDWYLGNFRMRIPTTGGIGINMSASDYTIIDNLNFQGRGGSLQAILNNGGSQCKILNSVFQYLNTATNGAAILGQTYTAIPAGWEIAGNTFHSNLRHILMTMRQSFIHDNLFQEIGLDNDNTDLTATTKLNLAPVDGGQYNTVTRNIMQGDYSITGGYKAATNDNWFGNISDDVAEDEVYDDGTTMAVPAA
jgi:hypothetical protein